MLHTLESADPPVFVAVDYINGHISTHPLCLAVERCTTMSGRRSKPKQEADSRRPQNASQHIHLFTRIDSGSGGVSCPKHYTSSELMCVCVFPFAKMM